MTTPMNFMTPMMAPALKMMQMQAQFAAQTSQAMMRFAMMPWQGMGMMGVGSICAPAGKAAEPTAKTAAPAATAAAPAVETEGAQPAAEMEPTQPAAAPVEETPVAATLADPSPVTMPDEAPVAKTPAPDTSDAKSETVEAMDKDTPAMVQPQGLDAPRDGAADDLKVLDGVGPKLEQAINEIGIYHYDQIAAWTDAEVAWIDENVAGVRGRCSRNGWVAQAKALAG